MKYPLCYTYDATCCWPNYQARSNKRTDGTDLIIILQQSNVIVELGSSQIRSILREKSNFYLEVSVFPQKISLNKMLGKREEKIMFADNSLSGGFKNLYFRTQLNRHRIQFGRNVLKAAKSNDQSTHDSELSKVLIASAQIIPAMHNVMDNND